jgi:hypothetical protein
MNTMHHNEHVKMPDFWAVLNDTGRLCLAIPDTFVMGWGNVLCADFADSDTKIA